VRSFALTLAGLAVGVALLIGILLATTSVPRTRVADGYVLFVGGLILLGLVRATRAAGGEDEGSLYEGALRRRARPAARPRELERLEREVVLASASSFDLHVRIRPVLREIAAHRLATRRGTDLDAGSAETRAVLGEELWELVRPDRVPPDDRFAPGLSLEDQRAALAALERI
jgi:hypothetical protein